jgi:uncharacterized protein
VTISRVVHEFSSRGTSCPGWLYLREGRGPHPCLVMAHGYAGSRPGGLSAYAERFAAAGIAVYVFGYRDTQGRNGEPRQVLAVRRQLADWHAAVETARRLDAVDASRVALWGSSFSGGHALAVAARDGGVAAVIAEGPHLTGTPAAGSRPRCEQVKLTAAGLRDGVGAVFRCRPYYIPVVGPPGTVAALTSAEAEPGYRAAVPAWDDRVPARIALPLPGNRPAARVQRIGVPVLYCVADEDPMTPPEAMEVVAARTRKGEVRHYPVTHFGQADAELRERLLHEQLAFLVRALGIHPATPQLPSGALPPAALPTEKSA